MSKKNYGIPYMGSKNRIAEDIIEFLPKKKILVDLFGGGGAISDCAIKSGKYEKVIYNELDKLPYTCFLKALKGEYENETRWISREDFFKLKDTDEYVACCFSFGNNFRDYMYNEKIEPYKRAYHFAIILDDFQPLSELFDEETVEMLKKSVEGETDKKQRRLKFTRTLGNYIIGLSKEAEVRKTVNVNFEGVRNLLPNQERIESTERKERLDTLKKSLQIDDNKNKHNLIQHYPRLQRLQEMRQEQVDNITFFNDDYRNIPLPDNCVIYCDIPYRNTGTYNKAEEFDYESFYDWCVDMKNKGYEVYISEYNIPDDRFEEVWRKEKNCTFSKTKNNKAIEKMFIPKESKQ